MPRFGFLWEIAERAILATIQRVDASFDRVVGFWYLTDAWNRLQDYPTFPWKNRPCKDHISNYMAAKSLTFRSFNDTLLRKYSK